MAVLDDRQRLAGGVAAARRAVAVPALHDPPAPVVAASRAGVACGSPGRSPRSGPGRRRRSRASPSRGRTRSATGCAGRSARSRCSPRPPDVRVRRGDAVRPRRRRSVDVDPQDLAEQRVRVLGAVAGVAAAAAVADADVQVAVRPEREHAAVVVVVRLVDLEDRSGRTSVRRGPGSATEAWYSRMIVSPSRFGVVHVELAVVVKLRVEREPEQALLAAVAATEVVMSRNGVGRTTPFLRIRILPPCSTMNSPAGAVAGARDEHRPVEARRDRRQPDVGAAQRGRRGAVRGGRRPRRGRRPARAAA